ncbi:MAG: DNA repair protein RadA [Lachnospiraceae bacterium]|nr:DNA repair protein RadA [Lachnospiraceae bacterium]
MAVKQKQVFFCKECGYESTKWLGQCPGCKEWNVFSEEIISVKNQKKTVMKGGGLTKPLSLHEVDSKDEVRISSNMKELNRVLGGGIVKGSLVLVGGDPGIGKSTLLLQMCQKLSEQNRKILYVSGEESAKQIKMRADRIGNFEKEFSLLCEVNLESIELVIQNEKPEVVIIDSIQTMSMESVESAAGSVGQVREVTGKLMQIAKSCDIAIFIVGHVTKEGVVAGPRTLEHMVDTVLYFEGDRSAVYRILRAVKNRFGSTNEIGMFEMKTEGLIEVENPSQIMLSGKPSNAPGSLVVCALEGTRPMLIEIQALVSGTNYNMPRRTTVGVDINRTNMLLAVIEKRANLILSGCDVYVNIAGGMRLNETAVDLGIIMAIVSSYKNKALNEKTIIFGEVGLTGEVRAVNMVEQRIKEAIKMGFDTIILPKANLEHMEKVDSIKLQGVSTIKEALSYL